VLGRGAICSGLWGLGFDGIERKTLFGVWEIPTLAVAKILHFTRTRSIYRTWRAALPLMEPHPSYRNTTSRRTIYEHAHLSTRMFRGSVSALDVPLCRRSTMRLPAVDERDQSSLGPTGYVQASRSCSILTSAYHLLQVRKDYNMRVMRMCIYR
jgi:hypothetical protein